MEKYLDLTDEEKTAHVECCWLIVVLYTYWQSDERVKLLDENEVYKRLPLDRKAGEYFSGNSDCIFSAWYAELFERLGVTDSHGRLVVDQTQIRDFLLSRVFHVAVDIEWLLEAIAELVGQIRYLRREWFGNSPFFAADFAFPAFYSLSALGLMEKKDRGWVWTAKAEPILCSVNAIPHETNLHYKHFLINLWNGMPVEVQEGFARRDIDPCPRNLENLVAKHIYQGRWNTQPMWPGDMQYRPSTFNVTGGLQSLALVGIESFLENPIELSSKLLRIGPD